MSLIILLILCGLVLIFFEIFVPGGILAIIGAILMLAGCIQAFNQYGAISGLIATLVCLFTSIGIIFMGLKIMPKTKYGRLFFLTHSQKGTTSIKSPGGEDIIGQQGETATTMAPSGMIVVGGKTYEAFSQSGHLDKGTTIEVVGQDNFRVIVKKA